MAKTKRDRYDRLCTVPLSVVIDAYRNNHQVTHIVINGEQVGMQSLRLQTFFHHGLQCSACGLRASHFAVERNFRRPGTYHLNLWGANKNGVEVLFTHDHTLARSLGGANHLSNTTTMCESCNTKKSKVEQQLKKLKDKGHDVVIPHPELTAEVVWKPKADTRAERKASARQEKIERMLVDDQYRDMVLFHQRRLGKNDYPEVFGNLLKKD